MTLLLMTLTSCVGNDEKRLERAAVTSGTIAASINLADLPSGCRVQYSRVGLQDSDVGRSKFELISEANQRIVAANGTIRTCASFYDNVKKGLRTAPAIQ